MALLMNRLPLVLLALATSATAAAQRPCTVVVEASPRRCIGAPEQDSTATAYSRVCVALRFTDQHGTAFVKPGCPFLTARTEFTVRDVVTGATVPRGVTDACDSPYPAQVGAVVALGGGEALELYDSFEAPVAGEYDVTAKYVNAPVAQGVCRRMREGPRIDLGVGGEPWLSEVACQMEESARCEVSAAPFRLVVSPRPTQ